MARIFLFTARTVAAIVFLGCALNGYSVGSVRDDSQQNESQYAAKSSADKAFKEGHELRAQGSPESLRAAIAKYEEALMLFRSIGDRRNEAAALYTIGVSYSGLGEHQKAIGSYNRALAMVREMGNRNNEAAALKSIGMAYDALGENQRALDHYTQAVVLQRAIGDRSGEATTLIRMGTASYSLGDKQKALEFYSAALSIFRAVADDRGAATTLHQLGLLYDSIGDRQKALDYYNQALPLWRAVADHRGEATTLMSIGVAYDKVGDRPKALESYNLALPILRATGDRSGEARTLIWIGVAHNYLGEKQKALDFYNQALTITRAVSDRPWEAEAILRIGNIYNSLGETQTALEYYNRALPILRAVGNRAGEASTLTNIGTVYAVMDKQVSDKRRQLEYYNQALPIMRAVGDRVGEVSTLNNIGAAYYLMGDKQKALEYYNQALPICLAVGDRLHEARTLSKIGLVYADLGDSKKAFDHYGRALATEKAVGDWAGEVDTLAGMMLLLSARNPSFAVFNGKQAVNALQQVRSNVTGLDKELQRTFLRTMEGTYRKLSDQLIGSGRLQEAQQVLNLFKDQQFFDFSSDAQKQASKVTLTTLEALFVERYEQITRRAEVALRQLDELKLKVRERQPTANEASQLEEFQAQLNTILDEFLTVLKQAELEFAQATPEKDRVGEIRDTRELQTALRELSRHTGQQSVAIYTVVGPDAFRALLITADGITAASQPIKGDDLDQKALQLWGLLQSDKYDPTPLALDLYSTIFKAIEERLPKEAKTILWSLDGNLRYLPMAALYDGKQYLIERYNNVVFTRADIERLLKAVSPRWTGLGMGSSRAHTVELLGDRISFSALPGVTEELRTLFRQKGSSGGVLDGEVLPDDKFTKTAMLGALKQKNSLVHISSHFAFRPGDEARSFLLLGDGSVLTLEEMKQHKNLFAGVELLTLSACNTAAQQPGANGREIDGFAELAQRLGAGSVMATLWPVADNSTPWLMREFYQTRENGSGLTKGEAFRRAQLALLNGTAQTQPLPADQKRASSSVQIVITSGDSKREGLDTRGAVVKVSEKDAPIFKRDEKRPFAHPHYWAAFILIGNFK